MPLYEYQCQECGEKTEVIQRFADDPYTICSSCGGELKKLISAPAIKFKGSGFYVTDYGKGNGKGTAGSDSSSSKDKGGSDSSKSGSDSPKKSSDSSKSSSDSSS